MQIAVGAVGHKTHVSHASSLASSQQAESVQGSGSVGFVEVCLESFVSLEISDLSTIS